MNEIEINDKPNQTQSTAEEQSADDLLAENQALKQMIRLRNAREALTAALSERGAKSPGLLFAYAVDDFQFDEEGNLENASALLRKLEKTFPEQFEQRQIAPSVNGGSGSSGHHTLITRETLSKMRPAEIAALDWSEVKRILSEK
jgi:hypothetical protein